MKIKYKTKNCMCMTICKNDNHTNVGSISCSRWCEYNQGTYESYVECSAPIYKNLRGSEMTKGKVAVKPVKKTVAKKATKKAVTKPAVKKVLKVKKRDFKAELQKILKDLYKTLSKLNEQDRTEILKMMKSLKA